MPTIQELADLERKVFTDVGGPAFDDNTSKFNEFLLRNAHVPKDFAEKFWVVFENELALTNFERGDVDIMISELDIAILNWKMSHAHFETTQDDVTNLDMLRAKTFMRAMRSTGGLGRERAVEATQIRQILSGEGGTSPQGGIMSSLAALNPLGKKK
jgi:hypothetical protein